MTTRYLHIESDSGVLYVYSDDKTHEDFKILTLSDLDYDCCMKSDDGVHKISIVIEPEKSTVVPKNGTKKEKKNVSKKK